MTEQTVQGSGNVSASVPLDDYIWLLRECTRRNLSKSAFVSLLIAEERKRVQEPVNA